MDMELKSSRQLWVESSVIAIEKAEIAEGKAIMAYKAETDPELKASHKEDAYLQKLIQVRESRLLGKEDYEAEQVEACTGMKYEELFVPNFEDYVIS